MKTMLHAFIFFLFRRNMSPMPMQPKIGDASLKFGPDWLRALSSDTGNSPGDGNGTMEREPLDRSSGWGPPGGSRNNAMIFQKEHSSHSTSHFSSSYHHQHHHTQSNHYMSNKDSGKLNTSFTSSAPETPLTRGKPSDFAYSREEMLAMYDKNLPAPDFLVRFENLFVEKMQLPLAFSQLSEEELVSLSCVAKKKYLRKILILVCVAAWGNSKFFLCNSAYGTLHSQRVLDHLIT